MFWGLVMDPNKRYTQTVEKAFHVSMASLDTSSTTGNDIVQVKLCYEGLSYLLCSLHKSSTYQVPLDLNFQEGTEISFTSNGKVHLTGYLIPEDDGMDMDDLEEEEVDEEEEEEDDEVPQLVGKQSKRKAQESPKESKKLKKLKAALDQEESSDDDEELDDDDLEQSLEIDGELEDDSDDVDDEEEEEDDSEEEEVEEKPQQKKSKKEQQQANKKQEKQKLVNGKDAKPELTKQEKKKAKAEAAQQAQQPQQKKAKLEPQQQQNNAQQVQKKRVVEGGVIIEDVKVGNGTNAKPGKFVSVYYIGRLTNGKKFDATQNGDGFKFRLGKGEVIKGWDIGINGMKIGGKRRITIPPGMAYGARGSPPVIPSNATLVFEVELKNVH